MKSTKSLDRLCLQILGLFCGLCWLTPVAAEGLLHQCEKCGKACHPHALVQRTLLCPVKVIETRVKPCVTFSCEEREETYTAFKLVPETRTIKKELCYLLDEVKSKEIIEKDCQIVDVNVSRVKNVKVPQFELDETCLQREVCTKCGPVCVEECCMEEKARLVDGISTEQDCEKQLVLLETKKEIFYCVKTPKKQTIDCAEETVYKLQPVEQKRTINVNVPKIEYQPYEVEVTKMLPQKVWCCVECSRHHH